MSLKKIIGWNILAAAKLSRSTLDRSIAEVADSCFRKIRYQVNLLKDIISAIIDAIMGRQLNLFKKKTITRI